MADQDREPSGSVRRYSLSTCWSCGVFGLVSVVLCVWIIQMSSLYQMNYPVSQRLYTSTPSFDSISHKHLYALHRPAYLVIHSGNILSSSALRVSPSQFVEPLRLPSHSRSSVSTHHHSFLSTPVSTPRYLHPAKFANGKKSPKALSFLLPPTPTPLPMTPLISTPTPVASLSTIAQRSVPLPLSTIEARGGAATPLPTLTIKGTPVQGDATPEPVANKNGILQIPESGTPVSGR